MDNGLGPGQYPAEEPQALAARIAELARQVSRMRDIEDESEQLAALELMHLIEYHVAAGEVDVLSDAHTLAGEGLAGDYLIESLNAVAESCVAEIEDGTGLQPGLSPMNAQLFAIPVVLVSSAEIPAALDAELHEALHRSLAATQFAGEGGRFYLSGQLYDEGHLGVSPEDRREWMTSLAEAALGSRSELSVPDPGPSSPARAEPETFLRFLVGAVLTPYEVEGSPLEEPGSLLEWCEKADVLLGEGLDAESITVSPPQVFTAALHEGRTRLQQTDLDAVLEFATDPKVRGGQPLRVYVTPGAAGASGRDLLSRQAALDVDVVGARGTVVHALQWRYPRLQWRGVEGVVDEIREVLEEYSDEEVRLVVAEDLEGALPPHAPAGVTLH